MKPHVKIYMKFFGFGEQDVIQCENCKARAVDIHHLVFRSQGGKNEIENLMALCRTCHNQAHDSSEFNNGLKNHHLRIIKLWKSYPH